MKKWRFIDSGFCHPYVNMAVDESLLENYSKTEMPVLRIYGWKPAGFSVGFSQDTSAVLDLQKCKSNNIPVVKRLTGGTIIFHDNEITYSLVCSQSDIPKASTVKEGYKHICQGLIDFYGRFRLDARFSLYALQAFKNKSAFCFASCQDYDIMINGKKIGGNAQRRKKHLILQHGSIPLGLDVKKINRFLKEDIIKVTGNTTCLDELTGRRQEFGSLVDLLKSSFESSLNVKMILDNLTEAEKNSASQLEAEKYSRPEWNINAKPFSKAGLAA
jgi:lipoate-protein ligase A